MLGPRRVASLAMAFAMVLVAGSRAHGERLLAPLAPSRMPAATAALPGVARVQPLALGRAALADLRRRKAATVAEFPLGADGAVDLLLTRIEPFAPGARVEVVEAGGTRRLPLPDHVYFAGAVRGDAASRALVVAAPAAVHGFVVSGGVVYRFGPGRDGGHVAYTLRDVDPAHYPPPGTFCANDFHPATADTPGAAAQALVTAGLVPPPVAPAGGVVRQADVAIETDRELRLKFGSDQAALDYLAALAAAATAIYERDVTVRLRFSYIRLWGAAPADPWTATATVDALDEVQAYWTNPANGMDAAAGPRDLVHFVSGKSVQGGVAYLNAVCDQDYGFGVSQVFGSFDLASPSTVWDVIVLTHELGHNFGSRHSHCYSPPVDRCYNAEPTCYSGPVVNSRGTIMSYCHLLGGVANIDLVFGAAVTAVIDGFVGSLSCLDAAPTGECGNAVLEPGEECDDGAVVPGDGCSPVCRLEACGNAIVDPGEECDDGNTTSGDHCSAACAAEPYCGNGAVDAGEECDDGNVASGDGCSAACMTEPCTVYRSAQTIWARARLNLQRPKANPAKLALQAEFGLPVAVDALAPATTGVRLILETAAGVRKLDASLPPGSAWSFRHGRWTYGDGSGSAAGIRKVVIRDRTVGGVPEVQVTVAGRHASYALDATELPPIVTLVLGDAAAGAAGACGRHAFGGGACAAKRRGTRLLCR
jgi:cysteine-rich repeat protein